MRLYAGVGKGAGSRPGGRSRREQQSASKLSRSHSKRLQSQVKRDAAMILLANDLTPGMTKFGGLMVGSPGCEGSRGQEANWSPQFCRPDSPVIDPGIIVGIHVPGFAVDWI